MNILFVTIVFAEYIISAYATTDILRLTKNSGHPVLSLNSYCPECGHKLALSDQIPIFSYYICHKKCRYCSAKIPRRDHILETGLFICFFLITLALKPGFASFISIVIIFELTKLFVVIAYGLRSDKRLQSVIASLIMNAILFAMLGFFFVLYNSVK